MLVVPLLRITNLTWPLFEDENSLQSLANFAFHEQTACLVLLFSLTSKLYTKGVTLPSFCLYKSEQNASFPAKRMYLYLNLCILYLSPLLPRPPHRT